MKYMSEEVIPYQIPETVEEFDAMEAEVKEAVQTLRKWGIESMETDGWRGSLKMRGMTSIKPAS